MRGRFHPFALDRKLLLDSASVEDHQSSHLAEPFVFDHFGPGHFHTELHRREYLAISKSADVSLPSAVVTDAIAFVEVKRSSFLGDVSAQQTTDRECGLEFGPSGGFVLYFGEGVLG